MKIALVLDGFDPRRGGVEQWTHQYAAQLSKRGHEVHVVAGSFGPAAEALGVIPHRVTARGGRLKWAQAAEDLLRSLNVDIIHDMGCGWYFDVLQPHGGSRRASFEHNLLMLSPWQRAAKRALARFLPRYREFAALTDRQYTLRPDQRVLALSQMVARHLEHFHHAEADRLRVVYNGVDLKRFSPEHRTTHRDHMRKHLKVGDATVFLIVAHNLRLKGVPALVQAMGHLIRSKHDARLVVVGGHPDRALTRLIDRLGCGEAVTFAGAADDPAPYYAAADVYVQPTLYDPCSLVVLEALASGLPVITSRFNGAGELITMGREGFALNDPSDDFALATTMGYLLDKKRRERMGAAARELAMRHSFEDNVGRILAVYGEILAQRTDVSASRAA